jgi:cytidylate kinase
MGAKGIVVAIDGPAGSGKSSTAKAVATRLGYVYLDTGAMYRALALAVLRSGGDPDDPEATARLAGRIGVEFRSDGPDQRVLLDGEDVTHAIRTPEVSEAASRVAVHAQVRRMLIGRQREIGAEGGIVLEGRDTGTAVFPDAELKVFLGADVTERARRRQLELSQRGEAVSLDRLVAQIRARDARDRETQLKSGPWPPPDALQLDTTELTVEAQVDRVTQLAQKRARDAERA